MALTANRPESFHLAAALQPDTWGQGLGDCEVTQGWYDHPYPRFSLLIEETKTFTDQDGHVVSIKKDAWEYDELTRGPHAHLYEEWAYVWLPGVTDNYALVKVQEERTIYFCDGWLVGGPMSHRTTTAGYVIYDLKPDPQALTPDQDTKVRAKGWNPVPSAYDSDIELRLVPDSGRSWSTAIRQAATVEKATAPQLALWRAPMAVEEERVTEDFQKIVHETWRKDFLQPGPPDASRTEELKDPLLVSFPVDLTAPKLAAHGNSAAGLTFLASGGDVDLKSLDGFARSVERIRPEKFALYRRVVSEPPAVPTSDPYGTYTTPPAYVPKGIGPIEDTAVVDFAGVPADPLPGATSYTEPEDPTPPAPVAWSLVCEEANLASASRLGDSRAILNDAGVVPGGQYEYYAVATLAGTTSPDSNHVTETYQGSATASCLAVKVTQKPDGSLDLEVIGPAIPGLPDGYGETAVIEAPVAFDSAQEAQDFAADVALRQFLQDAPRSECSVALAIPLLTLERGERVTIPEVLWETYGNGLHLSSRTVQTDCLLDGFSFTVSRKGGAWSVDPGSLELVAP